MTKYRLKLPLPDAQWFGSMQRHVYPFVAPEPVTYVPTEEAVEKIREIAYPELVDDGIVVEFEVEGDGYELATMVRDLEDELNAGGYWQTILHLDRPEEVPDRREGDPMTDEEINGYSIDLLARSLYDARKKIGGDVTDAQWRRHAQRFPASHRLLMEEARRIAVEDT